MPKQPKLTREEARFLCEMVTKDMRALEPHLYMKGIYYETGMTCDDIDIDQLIMGVAVESEHTDVPIMQTKIALDHLTEFPKYYDALDEMERELKRKEERKLRRGE